jgi:CRP/FNR family transcriptional regulator
MIDLLQPLIQKSITRNFSAGTIILYQGEVPRHACVLVKGLVRVYSISSLGEEQIVTFHVTGEFFPSSWIFGKTSSTIFFYEAVSDCEIAFMPRKELIDYMLAEQPRMHAMLDYFTRSYAASLVRINALEQPKARDKLAYTLFYLCQQHGIATNKNDAVEIDITLTHQSLAGLVGLTRETTAVEMNKLKKQGVITYDQQQYTVYTKKLFELMGEESFKNITISRSRE